MHLHQNTFTGGLDTDTSVNKYSNSHYLKSENFRVIMGGENSSGAITTVDGNKEVISFTGKAVIIGLSELYGNVVIFVLQSSLTSIYEVPKSVFEENILVIGFEDSDYLKLRKNFGHTSDSRLRIISRRETNTIRKIYFTDSNTPIYAVNLADDGIQDYDVARFTISPNFSITAPRFVDITSGSLKAGRVQYAYQLYNINGAETLFSPTSPLINITSSPESGEVRKYRGSDIGEITNKGVIISLQNLDQKFDRIRLVRILYEVLNAPPKIQVFKEAVIPSDALQVIDTGTVTLEEMVLEEFNELLIDPIPETLESKNNYLFVGNTTEEPFDFDFDASTKRCLVDGTFQTLNRNPFNDIKNDGQINSSFRYHPDGFLGGIGEINVTSGLPNVEYWFRTRKVLLDRAPGDVIVDRVQVDQGSYANPNNSANWVGYQRDEVYRFGLVGFDSKGRQSYVKWIGDIRMPDFKDGEETVKGYTSNFNLVETDSGYLYMNVLYPVFKIHNLPEEVEYYQIVRVERDFANRTVIDVGPCGSIQYRPSSDFKTLDIPGHCFPGRYGFRYRLSEVRDLLEYNSLEYLYGGITEHVGDRLDFLYEFENNNRSYFHLWRNYKGDRRWEPKYIGSIFNILSTAYPFSGHKKTINSQFNHSSINDPFSVIDIGGKSILNIVRTDTFEAGDHTYLPGEGIPGSCKILKMEQPPNFPNGTRGVLARRRRSIYPYGGYSESSLANSVYIPCSRIEKRDIGWAGQHRFTNALVGDTYIGHFILLKGMWSESIHKDRRSLIEAKVIVETTINPYLVSNKILNNIPLQLNITGSSPVTAQIGVQEEAGVHFVDDERFFEQDFRLYNYNSVYSQNNSTKKYFPKPMDFEEVTEWPNRVYYSDKKISGEFADSWLKLRPGNFTDLDTAYGELKLLRTFKDNLFFFQERGLGIIGVEQRELVQTDSPGPLIVGTGDVLSPPYYFSTDVGIQDKWHVTNSRNVIYFYDGLNKKFCRIIENGVEFISDTKNVSSLFNKKLGKVRVAFNPKYNEVLISTENEGVIVFNEYLDTFTSIYTTYHDLSELVEQELYTVGEIPNSIFKDSVPGSNTWYDESNHISKLTLIVNPTGNIVSVYDVLEFTLEILNEGGYQLNDFLTSVKVYNEYQESETFDLSSPNVEQRFRTWRINTLVDKNEARIRSSSMFVELTYDNKGNKLILHDIITKFRTNTRYQQKSE